MRAEVPPSSRWTVQAPPSPRWADEATWRRDSRLCHPRTVFNASFANSIPMMPFLLMWLRTVLFRNKNLGQRPSGEIKGARNDDKKFDRRSRNHLAVASARRTWRVIGKSAVPSRVSTRHRLLLPCDTRTRRNTHVTRRVTKCRFGFGLQREVAV